MTADGARWTIAITSLAAVFFLGSALSASWHRTDSPPVWRWTIITFLIEQCALSILMISAARDPSLDHEPSVPWRLWVLLVAVVVVDLAAMAVLWWAHGRAPVRSRTSRDRP